MRRAPLTIRLNDSERAALDAYAARRGMSAAGALRMVILEMMSASSGASTKRSPPARKRRAPAKKRAVKTRRK